MNQKRILIATDVPFWRRSTGAEQRIFSLVECLHGHKFEIEIFFVAGADSTNLSAELRRQTTAAWLKERTVFHSSADPPKAWFARLAWHINGTLNLFARNEQKEQVPDRSSRLADFEWPWARDAFVRAVKRFRPDVVMVEYVKLAYLLDAKQMNTEDAPVRVLDSHDLLFRRYQSFTERGEKHWIEISEEEEAAVFQKFDSVIAIQQNEAAKIREMAPRADVLVCTHACFPAGTHPKLSELVQPASETHRRLGILCSNNPANRSAIRNFLVAVWRPGFGTDDTLELLIAGSVCDGFSKSERPNCENIRWSREIDTPAEFYEQIDVVINPIEFGSGLKIKNVEAIAHGKPLITSSHGANGFVDGPGSGVFVADNLSQWKAAIDKLLSATGFEESVAGAVELSRSRFSQTAAYSSLVEYIRDGDESRK